MLEQIALLFQYDANNLFMHSNYNPWLVILSIAIAILASFMGFQIAHQAQYAAPFRKKISLFIGSLALGGGVWSMHFIGMLALEMHAHVSYNIQITIISVLPSILASWVALHLMARKTIKKQQLIWGGILIGTGIGSMHYIGMAAMEMAPMLRYNLPIFIASIIVAVGLAILALWISFGLKATRINGLCLNGKIGISSAVMGAAVSSMHYIGMAAARFVLPPEIELSQQTGEISTILALAITSITLIVIFVVLGANLIFRYKDISTAAINNERRLIATMNTAIDGIITIDSNGIIISVNHAVSKLLGWQSDEMIGQNVKMVVPMPDQHHHDQYIENYLLTGHAKIIGKGREVEALTKNGNTIPVRLGIGHVELNNQNMFVAFISDLRERKEMENSLRSKESKIRSLVTNIPGIAYRCIDTDGWPNMFINDEVEKMLGYPAAEFLFPNPKRSIADFVHPDDMAMINNTDLRHPDGYQLEFRIIDRDKNVKWALGHGRSIKDETSNIYYLDGFIMDITERKTMESALVSEKEKAEQAAATRAAFLANMSHEIRTPMNAIIGFSDILLDEELSNNQRKQINTINQSAKSLLHILNDILDSAKLDKGKFQLEYRDFSLVEEVDSVVSTLWLQAQHKGLEINLNIEKSAQGLYNGVPDRLRQVLTNLVGNALKFTEQGHVTIDIKSNQPGYLSFSISDTGIGMTAEQLDSIFDAFAQADESMSRRFGGTGLGTTISKQLVELMGGTISAYSEPEKGSTFEFSVPLTKIQASAIKQSSESYTELPQLSILIVDDIEQNLDLLSLILKRNNHVISIARNGEQALLKMESERFDLVLMDIQMPVMDGLTASKKRREYELDNSLPRLPIIALTASVLPQDKKSAQQAGMDGFANKPINIQQLLSEIAKILKSTDIDISPNIAQSDQRLSIDIEKGIDLWGSKTTLFNEILHFINQSKHEIDSFSTLIHNNNWSTLETLAHKHKGVAGNLAMSKLMLSLSELEEVARKQKQQEALACVEQVNRDIKSVAQCASKISKNAQQKIETEQKENKVKSNKQLLTTLTQLATHVDNHEFDDHLLDQLQHIASPYTQQTDAIVLACNNFDFELASERISALISLITS